MRRTHLFCRLCRHSRFCRRSARLGAVIYVCVPSHNQGATLGLLLWKVRQVFQAFPREYQFLVADDASTDGTREVLDLYQQALPVTVLRPPAREGYAAALERLLRESLHRTDRPKRDCALTLPADFAVWRGYARSRCSARANRARALADRCANR